MIIILNSNYLSVAWLNFADQPLDDFAQFQMKFKTQNLHPLLSTFLLKGVLIHLSATDVKPEMQTCADYISAFIFIPNSLAFYLGKHSKMKRK